MDWQKDDIEYAISSYVDGMNKALYDKLADGRHDFLCCHDRFHCDLLHALDMLEGML